MNPAQAWLGRLDPSPPALPVAAAAIDVLTEQGPAGFHRLVHELFGGATRRIAIASLYVGTGRLEAELLAALRAALLRSPALEVTVVLDHSRAQRRTDNGTSVGFVRELAREFPTRVSLYLHRLPQLDGARGLLPSPLDECIAVSHFKALVVDDVAVLTGANLSDEYFHCRQARYLLVRDPSFVDLAAAVVATAARHSARVRPDGAVALESPALEGRAVARAVCAQVAAKAEVAAVASDTWLLPMFQHPELGVHEERHVLTQLFADPDGALVVATPYTNFPDDYVDALARRIAASSAPTTFIVPSGRSHSFTTGRGLKALVPGIYLHREREIVRRLGLAASDRAELLHYQREGWVFHAKGVWLMNPKVTATVVGSSSFGARSVERDFDLSYLVVTADARLRAALAAEIETMRAFLHAPAPVRRPAAMASALLAPVVKGYM
jgi:CDP-diacylglycerol--glycerol-3-phosphate 3-phosphatidyltransferase